MKFFTHRKTWNDSAGVVIEPLKGFISSCCGVPLISYCSKDLPDECAICKKQMDDDTVLPIYTEKHWQESQERELMMRIINKI